MTLPKNSQSPVMAMVRSIRRGRWRVLAITIMMGMPGASALAGDTASLEVLRAGDVRLATIGYRLARANSALCVDRAPVTGMVVHAVDQYTAAEQADARRVFGFETAIAVEGVVPGSAAERAGIRAGDSIVRIAGKAVPAARGTGHVATRDAFVALLDGQAADRPLAVVLRRAGVDRSVTIAPSPGCRTLFELRVGTAFDAAADGRLVQISSAFLDRFADPELAVVVAHELAHNILRHRVRLNAAKVNRGLLSEFGRNGRLFRKTEDDADRLGVHLLRNAGWDPALAVAFWRGPGARIDGGIFHSRTHSSSGTRATLIEQEVAALPAGAAIPFTPVVLGTRDQPLR